MKLIYNVYPTNISGKDKKLKVTVNGSDKIISITPDQTVVTLDPVNPGDSIVVSLAIDSGEYGYDISFIAGDPYPIRASALHVAAKLIHSVEDAVIPAVETPVDIPVPTPVPVVEPTVEINTDVDLTEEQT